MKAVFKREFYSYFTSPVGYIVLAITLAIAGYCFSILNLSAARTSLGGFFQSIVVVFVILVPLMTMRLWSEEKRNKTDQLLLTSPASVASVVFGKYLAAVALFGIAVFVMALYPLVMCLYGAPNLAAAYGTYLGFFLLGCALLSTGLFVSALTESQITAAFISLGVTVLFFAADWIAAALNNPYISPVLGWLSLFKRFEQFSHINVLDLSVVVYYLSFSAVFLFLTVRVIERKRWS